MGEPKPGLIVGGLLIMMGVLTHYFTDGPHPLLVLGWLVSLILVGLGLARDDEDGGSPHLSSKDIGIGCLLALLFSPVYLLASFQIPFQVGSDELIHVDVERQLVALPRSDLFGLVPTVWHFPGASFIINGYLADRLGGITLENLRRVNGFFGLCIIFIGFLFFRLFMTRQLAIFAGLVLGSSHVVIGISRMGQRENMPLLVELIAFLLLIPGLRKFDTRKLFAGGAVMGLGAYTYFSARIVPLVWFCYLLLICWRHREDRVGVTFVRLALPTVVGLILSASPMAIAVWKGHPAQYDYPRSVTILTPEGRQIVREWEGISDTKQALVNNLMRGLGTFNNNIADHGMIYVNYGHGFVDPLAGALLWIGVLSIAIRRKATEAALLGVTGLLIIWLPLSLLTTKNPSYTRLLPVLPFALLLVMEGGKWFSALSMRAVRGCHEMPLKMRYALVPVFLTIMVPWNLAMYGDYVAAGFQQRDLLGSAVRYVAVRQHIPGYNYYIVMDANDQSFWFGVNGWRTWLGLFISDSQKVELLPPREILEGAVLPPAVNPPATLLMSAELWAASEERLLQWYPHAQVHPVDGNLQQIAIEVL